MPRDFTSVSHNNAQAIPEKSEDEERTYEPPITHQRDLGFQSFEDQPPEDQNQDHTFQQQDFNEQEGVENEMREINQIMFNEFPPHMFEDEGAYAFNTADDNKLLIDE